MLLGTCTYLAEVRLLERLSLMRIQTLFLDAQGSTEAGAAQIAPYSS